MTGLMNGLDIVRSDDRGSKGIIPSEVFSIAAYPAYYLHLRRWSEAEHYLRGDLASVTLSAVFTFRVSNEIALPQQDA